MMPLALLQLCDSLFPIGGFAHSDGLEAAVAAGQVSSGASLRAWIDVVVQSLKCAEGPALVLACRAADEKRSKDLESLDDEMHALRPASSARAASRAMGARLLTTWRNVHPEQALRANPGARLTLPVAFGVVCSAAGIDARSAVEAFMYTRLAATVSSAMRLMPIGQIEAHGLLAKALDEIPAAADDVERRLARGEQPGAFTPAFDVATMSQQYVGSRLFLS